MRRLFLLSLISLFPSVSVCQNLALKLACVAQGYPECVCTSCIIPLLSSACPNVLVVNTACGCNSRQYLQDVVNCVSTTCTSANVGSVWAIASSVCLQDYGVSLPTKPSTASSGISATANPNTPSGNIATSTQPGATSASAATKSAAPSSGGGGGKLSTGAIAGIAVGVVGGIAIGAVLAYLVLRHRRSAQPPPPQEPPPHPPPEQTASSPSPVDYKPELHSDQAKSGAYTQTYYPPPQQQQQQQQQQTATVPPVPELQSPIQTQPPPNPNNNNNGDNNMQHQGYVGVPSSPPPIYEMPNR